MSATELLLATGERIEVQGTVGEVERLLESAARGAMMELARLTESGSGETIAVNPLHVVLLRPRG